MRRTRMSFLWCRRRRASRARSSRFAAAAVSAAVLALAAAILAAGPALAAGLLLNEVLYDPEGADEGGEFIELVHDAAQSLDLGRVAIERGNGNRPGDWRQAWHGTPGESLAAGVHYVIGGALVEPPPASVAVLGLQNGPDACRLLVDGVVVDVLGWGELAAPEFFRGAPAPDVPAGTSLGRSPDGADTGRNAADFHPLAPPSPGQANRRPSRFRLRSPAHRSDAGADPRLEIEWMVAAEEELAAAAVEVSVSPCAAAMPRATMHAVLADGEAAGALLLGPLPAGTLDVCLTCALLAPPASGGPDAADTLRVPARAGPGPLRVNEFLFRPAGDAPEWVELVNASPDTLDASRYALADGRAEPVPLAGAPPLAPGALLVVAESDLEVPGAALVLGSRWPALNDTGMPIADRVRVVEEAGRTSDDVAYAADWAPPGVAVERLSPELPSTDRAAWAAAPAGASPGRPNGVALHVETVRGFLRVEPRIVRAGAGNAVLLQFGGPLRRGVLAVHASDGRLVRRFAGEALAGRRLVAWDGRDERGNALAPGLYLVSLAGEEAVPLAPASAMPPGAAPAAPRPRVARATLVVAP